jgi:predicted nucleic acid-binding protein
MSKRTKIVVDSDVLIHFAKGDALSLLPSIFPEYQYIILSNVYDEVKSLQVQLDNQMRFLKNITLETFAPTGDMLLEYAKLSDTFGDGESACMAYCKFSHDVVGSSNLKDIRKYCKDNGITYISTVDFLYYAYRRKVMTAKQCNDFIQKVRSNGSILPNLDIEKYVCEVEL